MDQNPPRPLKFASPEIDEQTIAGVADVLRSGGASGIPLLAKPFKVAELRQRIGEVLLVPSPNTGFGIPGPPHFAVSH